MPIRRIAWFYTELAQSGGGERLSLEGERFFAGEGIENFFLTYSPYDPRAAFEGRYSPRVVSKGDARFLQGKGGIPAALSQAAWLRRRLLEFRPDIVITEGTFVQVVHAYLATLGTGIPYAAQAAGSLFAYPPEKERSKYALVFRDSLAEIRGLARGYAQTVPLRAPAMGAAKRLYNEAFSLLKLRAMRKASRVFVHSERNRREVSLLYGRDALPLRGAYPETIFSHRTGSDPRGRLGLEGKKVVLTLSRHAGHKRMDLALRAFALLTERVKDAVLLVGGKSWPCDDFRVPEGSLRSLADELGVAPSVYFLDYVPEAELWDLYACCDAFIHMDLADFDIAPGIWSVTALGGTDSKKFKATLDNIAESARRVELPVIARDYGA
ncbi:MAG: glycosyltransferase, partial [Elusimicrobiota bacterium]